MPGSLTSVFGDADDYCAALGAEGVVALLPTEIGQFRARLTEIALHRVRLAAGEERLARIAFIAVPAGRVLVALASDGEPAPVWGGIAARPGDVITIGPGEPVHGLTLGPSRWATLQLPAEDLAAYAGSLTGTPFVPHSGIARWRPEPAAARRLRGLHRAAIRASETRSARLADGETAHGLEQQLILALAESLAGGTADREPAGARQHRQVLARFEALLAAGSDGPVGAIGAALGVSSRLLRQCCEVHLAMSPSRYRRRRAMQDVHRALSGGDPKTATVAEIAARRGFRDLGRFAGRYRAVYGELPSQTLRRGPWMNLR